MDFIPSKINQGEVLEVGLEIELGLSSGFEADCISATNGIKTIQLINLKGKILSIENKAIYIQEEGTPFIYRITLENFLLTCIQSRNEEFLELATNSAARYNNTPREIDYSRSTAYDKIMEINRSVAAIPLTREERFDGKATQYKPRIFTARYSPIVYKQLYSKDIEELESVKIIFEDMLQDTVASLFGTDNVFGVFETFPEIISTIDDELNKDYDVDTQLALEFLRQVIIDLKQHLIPQERNFTIEENARINIILSKTINAKYLFKGRVYNESISNIDGIIIRNTDENLIINTRDGLIQINKFELKCIIDPNLRKEVVKVFEKYIEVLTPSIFFDLAIGYLDDFLGLLPEDVLEIFLYLERLIKSNRLNDGLNLIKYLSTLK